MSNVATKHIDIPQGGLPQGGLPEAHSLIHKIPDWFVWGSFIIGALFIFAAILRFTPAGKYWKLFWKTWHNVAGDK